MMDDLVSRKWLLAEYDRRHEGPRGGAYQMILDAPSADRPTGHWKEQEITDDKCINEWQSAKCSVCGKYLTTPYLYYFGNYNYCPNCGSRMELEK